MESGELEKVIIPRVEALGFECLKLEVIGSPRSPILRLFIDKPGGVSIKDCTFVSKAVGILLDQIDPFPSRYLLEVSSPGSSRPLTKAEHFVRFAGHCARVRAVAAGGEKKTYTGTIRSCINQELVLDTDEGEVTFRLADIVRANLVGEEYQIDKKRRGKKGGV